jgi:hypothetical protein
VALQRVSASTATVFIRWPYFVYTFDQVLRSYKGYLVRWVPPSVLIFFIHKIIIFKGSLLIRVTLIIFGLKPLLGGDFRPLIGLK